MKLVKIFVFNHFFNQQFVLLFLIIAKKENLRKSGQF